MSDESRIPVFIVHSFFPKDAFLSRLFQLDTFACQNIVAFMGSQEVGYSTFALLQN